MKVLVACEESQRVCQAFRDIGHEAYSCDILPTTGKHPEWHIQDDVKKHLIHHNFDIAIIFPPCDHLAVSGSSWFAEKRADGRQRAAIEFFLAMAEAPIHSIAIENPIGIMSGKREYLKEHFPDLYKRAMRILPDPPQIIHPWQFGHLEQKATCLWLKNLPHLVPTEIVYVEMMKLPKRERERVHYMSPSDHRARDRARTYLGIARAMAEQWGGAP